MTPWQALGVGVSLGLGAGITPGPLLGLVINETLHSGWRAGILVALAPPIADLAVITLCVLLLARLPLLVFAVLGICGGLYVTFLGWETWRTAALTPPSTTETIHTARQSLSKGITVNLLNPHPYLFWLTVGGPLVIESYRQSAFTSIVAFVAGFYVCLVGAKVLLALLIHSGRARLQGRGYRLALRLSALLLLLLGIMLVWEGVSAV
ncbi:MAG: LysE family translocator, partial [Candidatus Binatia bacterium]